MSELIRLISAWEDYSANNSKATAADFCTYFLSQQGRGELFEGLMPPDMDSVLAKLIGRLAAMQMSYSKMALMEMPGFELDWFYFLNTIYHLNEAKKVQVIQYNFTEQTTGIDTLNRLRKLGYIQERTDPDDKRARLVRLTGLGEETLFKLYQILYKPTMLMYHPIKSTDKQVIINLLQKTEQLHQQILSTNKTKSIDDLLIEVIGETEVEQFYQQLKNTISVLKKRTD